jgi:flotillin
VLTSVVKATEAAMPLSEIERVSIIGGSNDTKEALGNLVGISPLTVAKIVEALKASGIDLPAMLTRNGDASDVVTTDSEPAPPS